MVESARGDFFIVLAPGDLHAASLHSIKVYARQEFTVQAIAVSLRVMVNIEICLKKVFVHNFGTSQASDF